MDTLDRVLQDLQISLDDQLTLILIGGVGGLLFMLILLKLAFVSMRRVDERRMKEINAD